MDDLESSRQKAERIRNGFATLRQKLTEARPDVIVIFGDDQLECFDFNNMPAFAVYVGEEFEGAISSAESLDKDVAIGNTRLGSPTTAVAEPAAPSKPARARLKASPGLGTAILTGLMQRGFDPAFCMDMPKPEEGVGHAFMRPAESLSDLQTPVLPVFINCYYTPQPTAMRCYQFGRAVREVIHGYPEDLRIAVIGSGGLWHTPGEVDAYLNEDFDRESLRLMAGGNIRGMAVHFDSYQIPGRDRSQFAGARTKSTTGLPSFGGPQGGTRETCSWITAAAVADGKPATIVDYIPVYASPIGVGFAYWPEL
jgi:hypothetical protein